MGFEEITRFIPTSNSLPPNLIPSLQWVAIGLLIVLFLWFRPQGLLPERKRVISVPAAKAGAVSAGAVNAGAVAAGAVPRASSPQDEGAAGAAAERPVMLEAGTWSGSSAGCGRWTGCRSRSGRAR